jgi:hypothetical protein
MEFHLFEYLLHMNLEIRVLYFDGCPNAEPTIRLVRSLLAETATEATVIETVISTAEEANEYHFLGSPSVQINDVDIEPQRRAESFDFSCRLYRTEAGTSGVPSRELLASAISNARNTKE